MAVQLVIVWQFVVPITVICVTGYADHSGRHIPGNRIPSLNLERTLAIYGTVTGTVSTGCSCSA